MTTKRRNNSEQAQARGQLQVLLACSVAVAVCMGFGAGSALESHVETVAPSDSQVVQSSEAQSGGASDAMQADQVVVLGAYKASSLSGDSARATNIALAAASLDGITLQPGQTLSFNDAVGDTGSDPRYQESTILNGTTKEIGQGGGICQVSTALYIAALNANLVIVERHPHSVPMDYAPVGLDATVDYGTMDCIIKNSTEHPITISMKANGQTVEASIRGIRSDDGLSANASSTIVSTEATEDSNGNDATQYVVDSYRTVYLNGSAVRTELLSEDTYVGESGAHIEATGDSTK